jgi:hypothetical protein
MGRVPKEDPQDKAARLRERRLSEIDQMQAAQKTAGDLTTDFRAVYGLRGLPLQFGSATGPSTVGGKRNWVTQMRGTSISDRIFSGKAP